MKNKFLLLTTNEDKPIMIGISNIALIEPIKEPTEEKQTDITLNFARNKDLWPKTIHVKESFDLIKSMIGFQKD